MVRHPFASLFACALSLTIAGCGVLETKKIDYKSAGTAPTLEVPPDLTAPAQSDRYALPETGGRGSATLSTYNAERQIKPADGKSTEVIPETKNIHVERAGDERWLVIKGMNADELWPKLRNFWIELGFVLNVDSPTIGVMETDWAEDRAKLPQDFIRKTIGKVLDGLYSVPERDKFRTRVEEGDKPGTLDVFISHRGMAEVYTNEAEDSTVWQPRPVDPGLEAEMLRRMMVYLGADEAYAKAQVATEARPERASIEKQDGVTVLHVDDPYARAWRRVGLALDRIGFTVEDRNRAEGVYFVRYIDPQADNESKREKSWLSKLAFWRSSDDDKVAKAGSEYRIQVTDAGDAGARVRVLTREGGADTSETSAKIIALLHDQLK
ncbi:outer membrane protein assembly factor BamC [Nitrogeniibacter mangrovi]|uniref:Outer membrane protein assembly factor BamC n=1 Tax=Nitrogeniibacter mangrovi TaxID=2016596 RepID=A0A6C1B5X0_9RHOO|nr:outer membrane protein assembly factor BamC [Nitrogeniibacter mangrovi]QID18098.1 outer membrane protein assembly factor BamC [Nitrogeniibacter mangrovi]